MSARKLSLSPEVKDRLRKAVLGGISHAEPAKSKPQNKNQSNGWDKPKPAAKILKKIIIAPQNYRTDKNTKTAAVISAIKPAIIKPNPKYMIETKSKLAIAPSKALLLKDKAKASVLLPAKAAAKKIKSRASKTKVKKSKTALPAKSPVKPAKSTISRISPPFYEVSQPAKPSGYKPFAAARRDWETPKKEESLEKLFNRAEKPKTLGKLESFLKPSDRMKPAISGKHIWLKLVGFIILLAVLILGYVALGIYKYGFNDAISSQVAKVFNLPAGQVNSLNIGVGEYADSMKLLAQPLSMSREGLIDYSGKTDLSDRIFYRLAANKLIEEKLQDYNKPVTKEEMDNQIDIFLKQTGSQDQAESIINNLYGINFNQFKTMVLLPMMQRSNLQQAIVADESLPINAAVKQRAAEALRLASVSSTDFSVLVKQYSDDEASVNTGGDLGWVVKGQLNPEWESLVFNTATGTVIRQPIKSEFGYHIVKVEQKLTDKTTGAESVKLRHILIKVDVDKYIKDLLDTAQIVKYVTY